ncbi:MAG: AAA family ATPase [Flavobacteriales bacterium]|nr:AAA family ATPase [Flavobacteriales bacterium]
MKNKLQKTTFIQYFKENLGFEPTQDQWMAMDQLTDFLWNISAIEAFILTGYAGTGKTSLISAFVKTLQQIKVHSVLMAPTGRAAKVLSNYSNKPASTIHRGIYSHATRADGSVYIRLERNQNINTLFIIDEASMLSTGTADSYSPRDLLEDLIEYVYSANNCKLIFVGDIGQLPPIGMENSPALSPDFIRTYYGLDIESANLSEIVRQDKSSGILDISLQLRNFSDDIPMLDHNRVDALAINGMELQEELESSISNYGQDEVMVVSRSNKRANLFNQQIRHRILWQEDDLNAGDIIMAVHNNYYWLDPKSEAGFLANGEMLEIKKIVRREEIFGFRFADVIARLPDYPSVGDVELKINLESIYHEGPSLDRSRLKELFYRIAQEEYPLERNKKKRNKLVMENPYFQAVQVKFGYAVTCHKAQGGQWEVVFVDHGYFVHEMWDKEYMRWLYTAITRAKSKLYLVNFDASFVGEDLD